MPIEMGKIKVKMTKPGYLSMAILDISKTNILNQSMETEQNCVTRKLIALLFIFLLKIFFEEFSSDVERWQKLLHLDQKHGHI